MAGTDPILRTDGLEKHYSQITTPLEVIRNKLTGGASDPVRAVDGVDLAFERNEITGVIGESGCGKTTLLETLIGLHEPTGGEIYFDGQPTTEFGKADWQEYRRRVRIIFQNPYEAMNPKFTVRRAVREPLTVHNMEITEDRIRDVLERVNLTPVSQYIDMKESQLSGGEKQRVAIARELIVEPDVIFADEPVSMLDVSTQVAILRLLKNLAAESELSVVYISHDISTVSYVCEEVNVMYLGKVVERAPTRELLEEPAHPYTRELLQAIPIPDPAHERTRSSIPGNPPDPVNLPTGCNFKDRCPAMIKPDAYDLTDGQWDDLRALLRAVRDRRLEVDTADDIRASFFEDGLPGGEAGRIVAEAIDLLVPPEGDASWAESERLLRESFEEKSVCSKEPVLYPTDEGHEAKCHLHYDHEQLEDEDAPFPGAATVTEGEAR